VGGTTPLMFAVASAIRQRQRCSSSAGRCQRALEFRRRRNGPALRPHAVGRGNGQAVEEFASGWLTPLMFTAREGDLESARLIVDAGRDVNAIAPTEKTRSPGRLNGNYELASFLVDGKSKVNQVDTQGFTPLFWASIAQHGNGSELPVDGHRGSIAAHQEAAGCGANPNALVTTPLGPACGRLAAHRVRHAANARGVLGRSRAGEAAAREGRDPTIRSRTTRPCSKRPRARVHPGLQQREAFAERLEVVKLFVGLGADVNRRTITHHGVDGAANMGDVASSSTSSIGRRPGRVRPREKERRARSAPASSR